MAREFIDGGGLHYDFSTMGLKWHHVGAATWTSIPTTTGRWAGRCIRVVQGGGVHGGFGRNVVSRDTYILQFAVAGDNANGYSGTTPMSICGFLEGSTRHVGLYVQPSTSKFQLHRGALGAGTQIGGNSVTNYAHDQFFVIQIKVKVHDSAGTVDVFIDGVNEWSLSGLDTRNGGTGMIDRIQFGAESAYGGGTIASFRFNDMGCFNTTGPAPLNDIHTEGRIHGMPVTGAGDVADWTPSTGANHQNVDDAVPDGNTTYNLTGTVGHRDLHVHAALPVTPLQIYTAQLFNAVAKDDAGTSQVAGHIKTGGVEYSGAGGNVTGAAYVGILDGWDLNPDTGVAWTKGEIDALQRGYIKVS